MQETHDESYECPTAAEASGASRLDEDPDQVVLVGGGWSGAIGHACSITRTWPERLTSKGRYIEWERISMSEFFLSPAAAILIAQGKPIQDFFPPDVSFALRSGRTLSTGPYFFLKGRLAKLTNPPPRLLDVVLGRVAKCPADMRMEDLRGLLLEQVL